MTKTMKLEPGEILRIVRRRTGSSRKDFARVLQVSETTLYNWESCKTEIKHDSLYFVRDTSIKLNDGEQCFILRNRKQLTQEKIAKRLKLSRYWVNMMENGKQDCSRLLNYFKGLNG